MNSAGVHQDTSNESYLARIENYIDKTNRLISKGAERVIACILGCIASLIVMQVFLRYVMNSPLGWTEEACLIMIVWMVFLGSVTVACKDQWIIIDALIIYLPERTREHLKVLSNFASIIFFLLLVREGLNLTHAQMDMQTPALEISWAWAYVAIPLSSLLLFLQSTGKTIKSVRKAPSTLISLLVVCLSVFILLTLSPWSGALFGSPLSVFIIMLTLFFIGMPVGISLGLTSMIFILGTGVGRLSIVPHNMAHGVYSFAMLAVPLFLLAGELMSKGGVTIKLIQFAYGLVGHLRGGLGHVSIVANLIMAGMSGSEVADAAATGSILIPAMKEKGYKPGFAAGIVAAASVIGPIFPPSIPFIIYAALANTSVLKLFLAGVVPGVIMALFLMVSCYIVAWKNAYPREARQDRRSVLLNLRESIWALLLPLIIIGGMILGVFTPTEGAGVAVLYALVLGIAVYRGLNRKKIFETLSSIAEMTAGIMYILATATAIGFVITREQIPQVLTNYLLSMSDNPWMVLVVINAILLFLGCFITSMPIMLIMIPILLPIIKAIHVDPVHFGVMLCLNVMMGLNTPPFGTAMFVVCKIADISIVEFTKKWWPFFIALFCVLALVVFVPGITLWFPSLFM
jgi:tripartite ATP-independent transporter DctM subunit